MILDKELLEAKAEESTQTRLKYATDISNLLFAVYFRLIKNPNSGTGEAIIFTNRMLLRPVLTGLAKFGHLMSIDYFQVSLYKISKLISRNYYEFLFRICYEFCQTFWTEKWTQMRKNSFWEFTNLCYVSILYFPYFLAKEKH